MAKESECEHRLESVNLGLPKRESSEQSIEKVADEMTHDSNVDTPLVEPEDVETVARDLDVEADFEC